MVDAADRPFPPGEYPVIVVGSGPGGLQLSYGLRRHGVPHAVISADEGAGGMFRRWPFFQRLLSWTKPYAPAEKHTREFQRYDWNSLLADEPELRAIQTEHLDGTSYFPSRPEMQANLESFAERAGIAVRYGTRWERTRREDGPDGTTFVLETTDGEYRTKVLVLAVGVAQPSSPTTPGIELAAHYADTRDAASYAGRRVFIIGKQNSGFELATGLATWASAITVCSPTPAKTSIQTKSLAGVRARYVQPFEDSFLGLGVRVLDASITGLTRVEDGIRVEIRRTDNGEALAVVADDVIAATGFTCPLLDLPDLGVDDLRGLEAAGRDAVLGEQQRPRHLLRRDDRPGGPRAAPPRHPGQLGRGPRGALQRDDPRPAHRRDALRLRHRAPRGGAHRADLVPPARGDLRPGAVAPEGVPRARRDRLARTGTLRDDGILPLAHALDGLEADMVAMTVEADGTGALYPVAYVRRSGMISEVMLPARPAAPVRHDGAPAALAVGARRLPRDRGGRRRLTGPERVSAG